MNSLSFKDYLASKAQLHEALKLDPIHVATYEVYKYCRVAVGESKELKEYHNLKPKQRIIVEWKYTDINDLPEPVSVTIPHLVESSGEQEPFKTFQSGERLLKWLRTNTREIKNDKTR